MVDARLVDLAHSARGMTMVVPARQVIVIEVDSGTW